MSKTPKQSLLPTLDRFYLKEALLAYTARFSTTKQKAAQMLERKIMRWGFKAQKAGLPESAIYEIQENAKVHIPHLLLEMVSLGAINDLEFGRSKVRHSAGRKSRRLIVAKLSAKGIGSDLLEEAIEEGLGEAGSEKAEALEVEAALRLAKKRKIGPFQEEREEGEGMIDEYAEMQKFSKELGIFARAGFGREIAMRVLKMPLEEALPYFEE
ncbi:regulatory protein RecX [Acetobacteraceae bacterium]|nr:regulatory protein RecX [Acetobacteraceae bacterium]